MELRLFPRPRDRKVLPVLFDDGENVCELPSQYLGFLVRSACGYSVETVKQYGKQLKYFCEFLAGNELYTRMPIDHVLATIPGGVIDQYLAGRQSRGDARQTVRNGDVAIKQFFEWMTTDEAGRVRQASGYENGLKSPSGKRYIPRFVSKSQAIELFQHLHSEPERCAAHFMYETGVRVSELPRVLKSDIDMLDQWPEEMNYLPLLVKGSKGRGGDHIKERYALLSRAVYDRLKRYHSSAAYRFISMPNKPAFLNTKGGRLTSKAVQKMIGRAAKRAGFAPRTISPHRLRHGTALSFLQGEVGQDYLEKLVLIQMQFGHNSIQAAEIYAHIPPAMFSRVQDNRLVRTRFEEAQDIFERTFLPTRVQFSRRKRT